MKLLYSNIIPLKIDDEANSIREQLCAELKSSDSISIAVGYISKSSLEELDYIINNHKIKYVTLVIGMYFIEGMPEAMYHKAIALNEKWINSGLGEIRVVRSFKYHGKLYAFYKNQKVQSAIIGSANLGVIKQEAYNLRQYEVSAITVEPSECAEIANFISQLACTTCSARIDEIRNMPLIREVNTSLTGIDTVEQIPQNQVKLFENHKTDVSFILPIKVPAYAERHMDDGKHFTKSNLNVSYAAPRSIRKSRDWYETQFTVSKKITLLPGYPEKNVKFFVITDDGYIFKAHTTSDGNKQFSAVGDELILGRWLKGRLVAAGLVEPVNDTQQDIDRIGMITKEMLSAYGCDTLVLTKINQKMEDEEGNLLDVWLLSFESDAKRKGDQG